MWRRSATCKEKKREDEMAIRSIGKADMHKIQCMPRSRNGLTKHTPGKGGTRRKKKLELSRLTARMQMDRPSIHRPTAQIDASTDSLSFDS